VHPDAEVGDSGIAGKGLFARAAIAASTADPGFTMDCACGAPTSLCRGTVTGDDWRLPELRERYGAHWVPVLLARPA
jgi:hypothetical protein